MNADSPIDVVRFEERLSVRTVSSPVERVRVQKVIVTEEHTVTVTVRREELRLVREPIGPDESGRKETATPGAEPRVVDMVLHGEQVVVERRVIPVERVRVSVDSVVTQQPLAVTLSHENVDVVRDPDCHQ
jgi:stress response protein YsnF